MAQSDSQKLTALPLNYYVPPTTSASRLVKLIGVAAICQAAMGLILLAFTIFAALSGLIHLSAQFDWTLRSASLAASLCIGAAGIFLIRLDRRAVICMTIGCLLQLLLIFHSTLIFFQRVPAAQRSFIIIAEAESVAYEMILPAALLIAVNLADVRRTFKQGLSA